MKPFSKILSTVSLGAALCFAGPAISSVSAQAGPGARGPRTEQGVEGARRGPHMRGRRGHGRGGRGDMAAALNLTEAQQAQMRAIRQQAMEQGRAARQSGDRAAMMAARRGVHEQMQAVLTPAQRAQAQQLRAAHEQEMFEHRMTALTERLSLSATQAQQVRGILSHANTQRRAIFEQSRLDETDPRAALEALHTQTQAQLSSVLSAEQVTALGELRAHHGRGHRGHRGPRGEGAEGGRRGPRGEGAQGPRGPRGAR
ncbi:MAG: hypothetical protein H6719_14445 [Sandaracinaceae bacterium]|nr:hypothetical protein [Sandaracinaceae bacterium]